MQQIAEYILSSGLRQTSYNTYSPRSWQMYVDEAQRDLIEDTVDKDGNTVKNIHAMTYDEAVAITGNENNTNGLRKLESFYWLASAYDVGNRLWNVNYYGNIYHNAGCCWGVRPVVSLKSRVYIKSGEGIEGDPYVLGIDQ